MWVVDVCACVNVGMLERPTMMSIVGYFLILVEAWIIMYVPSSIRYYDPQSQMCFMPSPPTDPAGRHPRLDFKPVFLFQQNPYGLKCGVYIVSLDSFLDSALYQLCPLKR